MKDDTERWRDKVQDRLELRKISGKTKRKFTKKNIDKRTRFNAADNVEQGEDLD